MKINNKRIFSCIILLIFTLTLLGAVNAADINDTIDCGAVKATSSNSCADDIEVVKKESVKLDNSIDTDKRIQTTKKSYDVNNYDELYDKIEDIKANSTNNEETIN
nr:hypothetical protein [uncultured Methanosphaera sp.]